MGPEVDGEAQVDRHQLRAAVRACVCVRVCVCVCACVYVCMCVCQEDGLIVDCAKGENGFTQVQASKQARPSLSPDEEVVGSDVGVEDAQGQQPPRAPQHLACDFAIMHASATTDSA